MKHVTVSVLSAFGSVNRGLRNPSKEDIRFHKVETSNPEQLLQLELGIPNE